MSLRQRMFGRMFGMSGTPRDASDDRWWSDARMVQDVPVHVSAASVVTIPEAYNCLQILSQTIASLPLITYRRNRDGSKQRFDDHPIAELLHDQPNETQTAYEFRAQMTWDMALHRNAFAEILEGRRGPIDQLIRLDPEAVWVIRDGPKYLFEVREPDGRRRRLLPEQVFHLKAIPFTKDGILGRSIIQDGCSTFARALALQDYALKFFANDATPGGIIEVKGKFTPEQAKEFKEKWKDQFTGRNRHKVAILDSEAQFKSPDVPNEKAQFIETYREVALQVLRFWRMPPHKVGILDKATFSNIEQQSLEFVTDTLMPWLVAWEQAIRRDLITSPRVFFAEHNVAGLLRGDIKSRYEAYRIGREWGWLSADDIRHMENMNPVPGGDAYLQPLNMGTAGGEQAQRAAFDAYVEREISAAMTQRKLIEVRS